MNRIIIERGDQMKKIIVLAAIASVVLLSSECLAFKPAVIGGIRDGVALGLMMESDINAKTALRFGAEISTARNPGIIFVGGKFYLTQINSRYPMFLSGGLVGYVGNNSSAGPYVSVIFERLFDIKPWFLEFGVDVAGSGKLQFQTGYSF